jgi:arginine utilization regulatory protein
MYDRHHEGVLMIDAKGIMIYYNERMAHLDGLSPADVLGRHILEIYDLDDESTVSLRCLKSGQPVSNYALYYQTRLGNRVNAICYAYPIIIEGRLEGAICYTIEYASLIARLEITARNYVTHPHGKSLEDGESPNGAKHTLASLVGASPAFKEAIATARIAAQSPSSVMICGETGTGKELFAQAIHNLSPRRVNRFCPINCAAIPEALLEGLLFGTVKGAFTGAIDRPGLFETGSGGTIYLDELQAMPMSLQAKLLRVIQEQRVRRVGGSEEKSVDLKIVCSINQRPEDAVGGGALRRDLYFRLAVIFLEIPPLRRRMDDVETLVRYFVKKFNAKLEGRVKRVEPEFVEVMRGYDWPGNVRELENVIETCMNFAINDPHQRRTLGLAHIQSGHLRRFLIKSGRLAAREEPAPLDEAPAGSLLEALERVERQSVLKALSLARGNRSEAARMLGVTRQNLHHRIKRLGLGQREARGS